MGPGGGRCFNLSDNPDTSYRQKHNISSGRFDGYTGCCNYHDLHRGNLLIPHRHQMLCLLHWMGFLPQDILT